MSNCNNCTEYNPCICLGGQVSQTPTVESCTVPDCCLKACDGIIKCEDSVGPCGAVGSYDLAGLDSVFTGCVEGRIVYRLVSFSENKFASVTISTAGVVTFVTKGPETAGEYGYVVYKIVCLADPDCADCAELRANGTLTIGVRNLCLANECDECETCNPCTGDCEEDDVNISANVVESNSNLTVE